MDLVSINSSDIKLTKKDRRCAPSKKLTNGSCIPLNILIEMAKAFNIDNKNDQIKLYSRTVETLKPAKYKKYLIKSFQSKLKNCDNQICWTKQSFLNRLSDKMKKEIKENIFRPKGPNGKFTWLNTSNIENVMKQYELTYPDFLFLGAVPIDFYEFDRFGIKNLDFQTDLIDKNKTKIGIVFNLDEHWQEGSHWTSMYSDFNKGVVYYFDSYGTSPETRILNFMNKISKFLYKKNNKIPIVDYNKFQHQKGNNACGLYSMNFILRLLNGTSFEELTTKRISDESVNECREFYFT